MAVGAGLVFTGNARAGYARRRMGYTGGEPMLRAVTSSSTA